MKFRIESKVITIGVCPGPLLRDGEPRGAVLHGRELLIAGDVVPADRLTVLVDQLRMLWEANAGVAMPSTAVASFFVNVHRQLLAQGGEPTLMRLGADGMVDAGGVDHLGADPVSVQCGRCGSLVAPGSIATGGPEFDHRIGKMVVRRSVECEHCDDVMSWTEGLTAAGTPNGRVVAGPFYRKGTVTADV